MKRSSLQRTTGLRAKKRITYRPAPPSVDEKQGRRFVWRRAGEWCEIRVAGVCAGAATDWQHRRNRSQQGTWAASNGLALCRPCHRYVHENPAEAMASGWTVPSWKDPASTPVLLFDGFVILGDDGQRYDPPHALGCAVWTSNDQCDMDCEEKL